MGQVGDVPSAHRHASPHARIPGARLERPQARLEPVHPRPGRGRDALRQPIDARLELVLPRHHHLGRRRRRRRPHVGHEVCNRHVRFVSDRRNGGHGAPGNRPRRDFLVERPEIFNRAAPASDDDHVDARNLADGRHRAGDIERGAFALHAGRTNHDVRVRVAAPQHLDDVAHGRALERRHEADLPRQHGQPALAPLVEQSFGSQTLLQLVERQLQCAEPFGLETLADELVFALRVVNADPSARDDAHAVVRLEAQRAHVGPEHHAANLRAAILEREIQVARVPETAVRQFALDPHVRESLLELHADSSRQLGDRQDPPRSRCGRLGLERLRVRFFEWETEEGRHARRDAFLAASNRSASCVSSLSE